MDKSFKAGMWIAGELELSFNAQRFATREEAEAAACELKSRWMLVRGFEILPSTDEVNYRFDLQENRAFPVEKVQHAG